MQRSQITTETTPNSLFLNRETGVVYRYTGVYRSFRATEVTPTFMSFTKNGAGTVRDLEEMGEVELVWAAPAVNVTLEFLGTDGWIKTEEVREDLANEYVAAQQAAGRSILISDTAMETHIRVAHSRGESAIDLLADGLRWCSDHLIASRSVEPADEHVVEPTA